jgi:hypothetical protein
MNASAEKWRPRADRRERSGAPRVALLLGAAYLGGCADIHRASYLPPVNPESPVAGAVQTASMQSFKRPSLASVPPQPLNIPPPAAVKTAVIDMVRCRRAYEVWARAHPALVSGTADFAAGLQSRLDNNPADRPTPQDQTVAEADAAKLRAYAEPPPPMHPGPPPVASEAAPPGARPAAAPPPKRPHAVAPSKSVAATAPAKAQTPAEAPAPAPQMVAIAQPSVSPLYRDPVLAHCQ